MKPYSNLLAGALGGLLVLVAGSILISTDVIETGDTKTVVERSAVTRPASDDGEGRTVADIYKDEGRGVVFVRAEGVSEGSSLFGTQEGTATGSGFLVDADGTIVTNAHVVDGADKVTVSFEEDGEPIDAEVKGRDTSTDLAVLKIDADQVGEARPLPLGDSKAATVGDPVVAIGNPFGFTRTVTTGIVSAVAREIQAPNGFQIADVIQTDASINPGNSGGPLLDAEGRVIGINSQIATGGTGSSGSVGIGFAVPVNTAKKLLPQLRQGRDIERAYLGVRTATVTAEAADELDLARDSGALLDEVTKDGPADDAGLRDGDLVVQIEGKTIADSQDLVDAVAAEKPGDRIEIVFYRGDDRRTERVELGERPDEITSGDSPDEDGGGLLPQP